MVCMQMSEEQVVNPFRVYTSIHKMLKGIGGHIKLQTLAINQDRHTEHPVVALGEFSGDFVVFEGLNGFGALVEANILSCSQLRFLGWAFGWLAAWL
jgi:hypothetical protein